MELLQRFNAFIKEQHLFQPKDKLLLAVSGGADSVVLAAVCKQAGFDMAIAHCNFQLRGDESNRDETFVKKLAEKYEVPFHVISFDTNAESKNRKSSIEETARDLRYDWFAALMKTNGYDYLLTAHHADDNIETVLMNFFRGTGIKGLKGIRPKQNHILRPLLFARRKEIEQYAAENNISFITDSSNAANDHTRNFFRNELIPSLSKIFPQVSENILDNISRFSEAEIVYRQATDEMKKKLLEKKGDDIHIPVLKLLKSVPLHTVLYEIIADYGFSAAQTDEVKKLLEAGSGKYISSSSHRILKNRNWLIISPLETKAESAFYLIEEGITSIKYGDKELKIQPVQTPADLDGGQGVAYINAEQLHYPLLLRKWKTGDYFYPLGMKKKKKLSRFFSDIKLSLKEKENCWLIESDQKIVWVIGYRMDDRFKIILSGKDTPAHVLRLSSP